MPTPQRLPFVNGDDGQWGDILVQWLKKEHYDDGTDNSINGGHQKVTLRAGTATAGTAPLKFTSGTLLTSAEAGALEFLSDKIYFTVTTGPTRKTIAIYDDSSGATGDIYYRDSSGNFTRLGVGSNGDILKLVGGLPSWQTPSSGGDASTNTSSSVDGEVALFSATGGKTIKRATGSGLAKLTSGVLSTATSGTDYAPATSGSSILKGNGSGGFSSASSGTDYAPATSGTSILKGDGSGGFSAAVSNTDYAPVSSPTFTGTVTLPSGQFLSSGTAGEAPVTISNDGSTLGKTIITNSYFLVNIQQLAMYGNASDSSPGLNLVNSSGGQGSLGFGPGGSSGSDVIFARTGTAAASLTGTITFNSAPVISSISNTGTLTLPTSTDTLLGRATTDTLTNKRITRRSSSTNAPGATPTINTDNVDIAEFTGLNTAITSMTTNLSGTPNRGDTLQISFTDNGTGRAITWGTKFEASTVSLPTTTVAGARLDVHFTWNTVTSKWRLNWKS